MFRFVFFSIFFLFSFTDMSLHAVYINRFTTIDNGAILFTGNTLGLSKASNLNQPGTLDSIGAFITIDTNQQVGSFPPGTTLDWDHNSSSANLDLPPDSQVLYAELIWSGSWGFENQIIGNEMDSAVKLITPQGAIHSVLPDPITKQKALTPGYTSAGNYTRSANVTSIIQAAGAGNYTAGKVAATISALDNSHNAAGWTLAVCYHDGTRNTQNLSIFVGCEQGSNGSNQPAAVTGFCAPTSGLLSGTLFVSAIEGDANKQGDRMLFGSTPTLTVAANSLSGDNNPINNFFCGQINTLFPFPDTSASLDTRGTFGDFNSNPITGTILSGSRIGYDITAVDISNKLVLGQTSAYALGTTSSDDFTINALGIQIPIGSPRIQGSTTINSLTDVRAVEGDILTVDFIFENNGYADADAVIFRDLLETGLTYVPNTFYINGVLKPDPDLTTGYLYGSLPIGSSFTVQFKVEITGYPVDGNVIFNTGYVDYDFTTCVIGQTVTLTSNCNVVDIELPFLQIPHLTSSETVNSEMNIDAEVGDVLTFFISVTNDGTGDALDVVFKNVLEPGLTLLDGGVSIDNITITPDPDLQAGYFLNDIVIGQTREIVIQAKVIALPIHGFSFLNQTYFDYEYHEFPTVFTTLTNNTNNVTINLDPGLIPIEPITQPTPAPTSFNGSVKTCKLFDKKNFTLETSWKPIADPQPIGYRIYQNGKLKSTVSALGPYTYTVRSTKKSDFVGIEICAIYPNNIESARTPLNYQ